MDRICKSGIILDYSEDRLFGALTEIQAISPLGHAVAWNVKITTTYPTENDRRIYLW